MNTNFKYTVLTLCLWVVFSISVSPMLFAQQGGGKTIRVRFSVRDQQGQPIRNAVIIRGEHFDIGRTNEDGKVFVTVASDATLKIYAAECEEQNVNIDGRQEIEVILSPKIFQMDAVVITSKSRPLKKMVFEPTDIEVKGNYLHLRTRFRVPMANYNSDTRLIVQPILVDMAASSESLLHPYVTQGSRHTIARERAFGFEMDKDPLEVYRVQADIKEGQNIVSYHDSLYVRYGNDDYLARVLVAIEDYRNIVYLDTLIIAKGTANPLRFLDYNFASAELNETALLPTPEMALFSDKGTTRIVFDASSTKIDLSKVINRQELEKINTILSRLRSDSMLTIKSIIMDGFASPEGNSKQNERLANRRTESLMESVRGMLGASIASQVQMKSTSQVASWDDVAEQLEQDGKQSQADEVRRVLHLYRRDPASHGYAIRRLPFYRSDIIPALGVLRRVEYTIDYSEFRTMSDDEIWAMYRNDKSRLTRYDYYRLIETAPEDMKELLLRESLKLYPGFLLAANRLALSLIAKDSADLSILAPFVKQGAPAAVIANQLKMHIMLKNIEEAAELADMLPNTNDYLYNKAVIRALNGDFAEAYSVMGDYGGLNEVLLLLALKKNEDAYQKVKLLDQESAKVLYIRAICADKTEDISDAINSMKEALKIDPSLADIARVDSDATDIFNLVNDAK